jgi:TRAP-type C4-dicarboxylate transport system permease small subunit
MTQIIFYNIFLKYLFFKEILWDIKDNAALY